MSKNSIPENGIYDARELGVPKMLVLGVQHMFAMFGATVLVPVLTGLSVSATLLFAGLGTLLFHFLAKGKVPAFLGSSFAFIGGYQAIAMMSDGSVDTSLLPYACFGVALAGLLYVVLAALFKAFGAKKVMRFFPPIVTGPVIICIGLTLSSSAINNCQQNWGIALVAILVVVAANIFGKGMIKIIPILLGVLASYLVAAVTGSVDFTAVKEAAWVGVPFQWENTVFGLFGREDLDASLLLTAAITIMPCPWPPWSSTSATCAPSPLLWRRTSLLIPACTAACWATAWPPPWPPCSALPPTPPMVRTPAFWP